MTTSESEDRDESRAAPLIRKGPEVEEPLRLAEGARESRSKPPSPTERYEARVDGHIEELRRDKARLEQEVDRLRADARSLADQVARQGRDLTRLETAHAAASDFNWLSSVLIVIGGVVVSYATFLHPASQMTIATAALVGIFIGVGVQGYNSRVGARILRDRSDPSASEQRTHPNPPPSR